jgi:hypothetical protein
VRCGSSGFPLANGVHLSIAPLYAVNGHQELTHHGHDELTHTGVGSRSRRGRVLLLLRFVSFSGAWNAMAGPACDEDLGAVSEPVERWR